MPQTLTHPDSPDPVTLPPGPITPDLKSAIEQAITDLLGDSKRGAVIGVATRDGVVAGVAMRINDTWKVGADVEKAWGGPVSGRVMIMGSW